MQEKRKLDNLQITESELREKVNRVGSEIIEHCEHCNEERKFRINDAKEFQAFLIFDDEIPHDPVELHQSCENLNFNGSFTSFKGYCLTCKNEQWFQESFTK